MQPGPQAALPPTCTPSRARHRLVQPGHVAPGQWAVPKATQASGVEGLGGRALGHFPVRARSGLRTPKRTSSSPPPRSGLLGTWKCPRGRGRLRSAQMTDASLLARPSLPRPPAGPSTFPPWVRERDPCRCGKPTILLCTLTPFLGSICLIKHPWSHKGAALGGSQGTDRVKACQGATVSWHSRCPPLCDPTGLPVPLFPWQGTRVMGLWVAAARGPFGVPTSWVGSGAWALLCWVPSPECQWEAEDGQSPGVTASISC